VSNTLEQMRSSYDNTILASSGTRGVVEPREPAWYSDSFGERHGEKVVKLREQHKTLERGIHAPFRA